MYRNLPVRAHSWWPNRANVKRARDELRDALAAWNMTDIEDPAVLVLSELLTNAIRHARVSPERQLVTWFYRGWGGGLRIEVEDFGERWFCPDNRRPEGGRGLLLVEALSVDWGVSDSRCGFANKSVWAIVGPSAEERGA